VSLIQIWDINGQLIDLEEYGLTGLRLIIPSPSYETVRESIPGRGMITLGKDLLPRDIVAEFKVSGVDYEDSLLVRDELYTIFSKGNMFYIGEAKQPGKRWLVECTEQWSPERLNIYTLTISIPLLAPSGTAESIGTTIDPFTFDEEVWQVGGGLLADEVHYTHTGAMFNIYNAGIKVDPRYMDLVIEYKGASSNLTIKNETTGDMWEYNGSSNVSDTIKLDGVRSEKNGLTILRDTNKRLISLAEGWNGFRLTGTQGSFTVTFKFRFHTL